MRLTLELKTWDDTPSVPNCPMSAKAHPVMTAVTTAMITSITHGGVFAVSHFLEQYHDFILTVAANISWTS
jgi:hypothetical protein